MISPTMTKIIGHLPKGLVRAITRKLMNGYINKYAHIKVENREVLDNIRKPVLFICNHLSNSDALVLNTVLKEHDVTYVAGVKLGSNPLTSLGLSIIKTTPVHPNSADKEGIKRIIEILKDGNNILIFPEGTRSRTGKMIKGKKGILLILKLCKVPVVPIGMTGTEKLLPINMEGKMEQEKFQHADITLKIGEPFMLPKRFKDEPKKEYEERAMDFVMKNISKLLPEEYRGEYL